MFHQIVVGIDKKQIIARCSINTRIACSRYSAVHFVTKRTKLNSTLIVIYKAPNYIHTAIRRTVVNDDALDISLCI